MSKHAFKRYIIACTDCVVCGSEVTEICEACDIDICKPCHDNPPKDAA